MTQPVTIGDIVENWTPRPHPLSNPQHHILLGKYCRLESRVAALRFGFQYEGTWMKAEFSKERSRDTAWFSIVDDEWPQVKDEFQRWLNAENFGVNGQQLTKLNDAKVNSRHHKITDSS
ncbi:unnamed protein product [Rotaria socialis]|uniref:Uncharacterized protein n=1 Tax=Rotaria socialis TaxID=392032 RepID=A0A818VSJ5_9BILA|nr:unnamed protein product [Rotaria socialis]